MADDERAIRDLIDTWMSATRAEDTDTVLGLMTEDVVFMTPGREPFGKAEFAAAARAQKGVRIDGDSDIRELKVLGDWAYVRNFLRVTLTPPGGEGIVREGHTLTILRKGGDGKWRISRDANLLA